ncbi:MAG: hypothetical protein OHK0052_11100 [Anaerolineales bacterium]
MKRAAIFGYITLITAGLFALFHARGYDDPYITFRYAQNFAAGNGLVYNPGEHVLSTTAPLWALILSIFAKMGVSLPLAANFISALAVAVGGLMLVLLGRQWRTPWQGYGAALAYPLFPLLMSTFGSETPLYLALALAAMFAYSQRAWSLTALLSALATLARPDAVLVPLVLGAHFVWAEVWRVKTPIPWRAALLFAAVLLAWALPAWWYYGSPLPVTLAAKQAQGLMSISQTFLPGFGRVVGWYTRYPYTLMAALAVVGVLWSLYRRSAWLLLLGWSAVYFAAYTILGVSAYFWYYAPLVPGFVAAAALGIQAGVEMATHPKAARLFGGGAAPLSPRWLPWGFGLALWVALLPFAARHLWAAHLQNDARLLVYRAAGEWLNANTPQDAAVGMLEVGIVGYYAQRPVVDFAGLIQPAVARQIQPDWTYETSALWALETYRPPFVLLHDGLFTAVEQRLADWGCAAVANFTGSEYNYTANLTIYNCKE